MKEALQGLTRDELAIIASTIKVDTWLLVVFQFGAFPPNIDVTQRILEAVRPPEPYDV